MLEELYPPIQNEDFLDGKVAEDSDEPAGW